MVGIVLQEDVTDRVVILEREIALAERGRVHGLVPVLETDPDHGFERTGLSGRLFGIAFRVDPERDLIAVDDLVVGVSHVVLPEPELAQRHESRGGCLSGRTERTLHHLDSGHQNLPKRLCQPSSY